MVMGSSNALCDTVARDCNRQSLGPLARRNYDDVSTPITSDGSLPDPLKLESLMLNIGASLRVHARHQLFTWTQGLLQNLIKHELLTCALRNRESLLFHVDGFATPLVEPAPFS